jgi:LPXTG-motif cell wall-anchored protein
VRSVHEPETNGANDASARSVLVRAPGNGNGNGGSGGGNDDDVLASLAHTGADVASGAGILFVLAAIGLLALLAGRRRRTRSEG